MGAGESAPVDLFVNDNWDANQYFRDCFQMNGGKVRFNMHCTMVNML